MKVLQTITGVFIVILAVVVMSSYTSQEKWKVYKTTDFYMSYPASWTIDTSKRTGARVMLYSPLTYSNDTYKENINVSTETLSSKVTLDSYTKDCKKELGKLIDKLTIISIHKFANEQGEFEEIIFMGESSGVKGKWIQHYHVKNSTGYVITLSTRVNTFDQYKEIGLKIMNSFSFKL